MRFLTRSLVAALAVAFGFSGACLAYEGATVSAANSYLGGDCGCASACDTCGGGCYDSCCGSCCDSCCDPGLLGGWGFFSEAELLFLRYHRADGVRIGTEADEAGEFDFEPATRFSLGTVAPGGIGARVRWFDYDHHETIELPGNGLGVDTYTLDFELFEAFALNQNWAMEISGGVRYVNFQEAMIDSDETRLNGFNGAGLITGVEARRAVGGLGLLYARTRLAVVQDDKIVYNSDAVLGETQSVRLIDTTGGMLELAVGSEVNYALAAGPVLFARSGLEWHNWWNFSSNFATVDDAVIGGVDTESIFSGASDVGFGGFTFSLGMSY
jgi:hypothetical protein